MRSDGSYMSKMDGCDGEVRLAEVESYKKWGIEIRVRFRSVADEGKMSVLDKRVHSGGERSVSTILFLMALQVWEGDGKAAAAGGGGGLRLREPSHEGKICLV